ncbi:tetratricopeptide repeat protein [Flagellimonas zhangzhouensis]|uniref:Tetratricopeptide repeat-containing protein n=1 Tax=Flagellimonas zhangzhouensis TaxID=1073328 RepID=A0A1H2Z8Y6_9FLAO|nr:tetratricopeptide repeat protein [Allomuricauda zhangzhouensis]SDR08015.1 Tetratricopeptide repeat-containing protein [Allomuricauda zhangzhouensis]SDX13796.1 Tetratricopeptide repeat-containing protein [Allomuricauda zhangzhouensis]
MKKFFKIIGFIIGFILVLIIGFGIYIYFWNENRIEKSKELSLRIENFESEDSDEYMEYSVAFNKAGDFERGFKFLNKAVELDPKLHLGYRGWIRLRKLRDYDKALEDFNRLDSLTPKFIDAPWGEDIDFLRGECYFGKKNYQKAIELFNRNIENQKEDWVDIHNFIYLGHCEYKLGNYQKANTEYQRALKQTENIPEAYFGMAKAYQKLGQIEKAKETILKAEKTIHYKRDDIYNEFLNEIYLSEVIEFKQQLNKI